MSNTPAVMYTALLAGAVEATGDRTTGWLRQFYNPSRFVQNATQTGSVQVPKPSAFTVGQVSLGTPVTMAYNNTYATLTFRDRNVPIAVTPSLRRQFDFANPENIREVAKMSADALMKDAAAQVIADLVAATPGKTTALATGKIDFVSPTAAEIAAVFRSISYVEAHSGGGQVFLVFEPTAWGNFSAGVANLSAGAITLAPTHYGPGVQMFNGYPCYVTASTATAWGGASNACCYILHTNSYAFTTTGVYPHYEGGFWQGELDGGYYHIDNMTSLRGVLHSGLIAEITNGTS